MSKIETLGPSLSSTGLDAPGQEEATERTVKINLTADQRAGINARVGRENLHAAIGYLSLWNLGYPHVNIYPADDTDLIAVYYLQTDSGAFERAYTIGAVFNSATGKYGFHS